MKHIIDESTNKNWVHVYNSSKWYVIVNEHSFFNFYGGLLYGLVEELLEENLSSNSFEESSITFDNLALYNLQFDFLGIFFPHTILFKRYQMAYLVPFKLNQMLWNHALKFHTSLFY